jgi:hypothetical protein
MKHDDESFLWLFLALAGIALVILGLLFWAVVCFALASATATAQYQRYLEEAEKEFDETVQDLGVDLSGVGIFKSIGIEVPEVGGFETVADWMAGTPLGVSEQWQS